MPEASPEIAVILCDIRSVHNVGSIFRTADGAGVRKIYLCGITPAPIDRFGKIRIDFAKVALGAEKYVDWRRERSAARLITKLRNDGYAVFAVEQAPNSVLHNRVKFSGAKKQKIALVLGNEVAGLPRSVLDKCDKILEIPMHGCKESLNVAVAFGVAVFSFIS